MAEKMLSQVQATEIDICFTWLSY